MKITFDSIAPNPGTDYQVNSNKYRSDSLSSKSNDSFSASISVYGDYSQTSRTKKDIAALADNMDVTNMVNSMTVMANTMSEEDFAKACEDGIDMSDMNVSDSVTILDKIKLAVSQGGSRIEGFTDDIDKEALSEMTGSEAYANALKKSMSGEEANQLLSGVIKAAGSYDISLNENLMVEIGQAYASISSVEELSDGMKQYLISNKNDLTIDDVFRARYSGGKDFAENTGRYFSLDKTGYIARTAGGEMVEDLDSQIEDLLTGLDMEITDENIDEAKWLVAKGLEVNKDNLQLALRATNIKLPLSIETFAKVVCISVSEGRSPKEAHIDAKENIYETAVKLTEKVEETLSSEDLDELLAVYADADKDVIKARRVLEEVRLNMTTQANLMLLKSDFSIDTKDMIAYVEALKKLEAGDEYKQAQTVNEVSRAIEEVKVSPVSLVNYVASLPMASLEEVTKEARSLRLDYETASRTYEAVGTQVRRDLGDSLKKAFSNIDGLIKECGLEVNDITKRAARILGYNQMEITKENLSRICQADNKLMTVLNKLSPKDTIELIKEGKNPMKMTIDELDDYIKANENTPDREMEKYSKFLYKLEKNDEITQQERTEYIEVYRLIYELKKGDYAALGAVVNEGRQLSLSNLKQAVSGRKHAGMDVKIDSSFGFLVDGLLDEMEPERLKAVTLNDTTLLSTLYDDITKVPVDEKYQTEYVRELHNLYQQAMNVPKEVVTELVNSGEVVSSDSLLAAAALMKKSDKTVKKLDEVDKGRLSAKAERIKEGLLNKEEAANTIKEVNSELSEEVFEQAMESEEYIDVRELALVHKQLSLATHMAQADNYKVPVQIDGQLSLANIKIVHNSKEQAGVVITIDSESLGHVSARLTDDKGIINGYISTNLQEAVEKLQKVSDKLSDEVSVVYSANSDSDEAVAGIDLRSNQEEIPTDRLFAITQKFLNAISIL